MGHGLGGSWLSKVGWVGHGLARWASGSWLSKVGKWVMA